MSIYLAFAFVLFLFAAPMAVLLITAISAEHGASTEQLEGTLLSGPNWTQLQPLLVLWAPVVILGCMLGVPQRRTTDGLAKLVANLCAVLGVGIIALLSVHFAIAT